MASGSEYALLKEAHMNEESRENISWQAHAVGMAERYVRTPCLLQGFKQQTAKWPLQPIQAAAAYLIKHSRKAVVADFGCGDAELARMAPQETVHSLDLVSSAPGVIACNMADTPLGTCPSDPQDGLSHLQPCCMMRLRHECSSMLRNLRMRPLDKEPDGQQGCGWGLHWHVRLSGSWCSADTASVDVAVFCLALMGTDYPSFLREAARVLKPHGTIWIAEVCMRSLPIFPGCSHPSTTAASTLFRVLSLPDPSSRTFKCKALVSSTIQASMSNLHKSLRVKLVPIR